MNLIFIKIIVNINCLFALKIDLDLLNKNISTGNETQKYSEKNNFLFHDDKWITPRIVGGQLTNIEKYPFMVGLKNFLI